MAGGSVEKGGLRGAGRMVCWMKCMDEGALVVGKMVVGTAQVEYCV